jgi:hypothetical protein
MIEDKLTRTERRRLECVAQAIAAGRSAPGEIVSLAEKLESFIKTDDAPAKEETYYDENTLDIVDLALLEADIISRERRLEIITVLQNRGILFRERMRA